MLTTGPNSRRRIPWEGNLTNNSILTFCGITTGVLALCSCLMLFSCGNASNGIVVESVNNYGDGPPPNNDLFNSIANDDGFVTTITGPGTDWFLTKRWTDANVWDSDFIETTDSTNFDQPGTAISYYTGHGGCPSGSTNQACTSSSQCTNPVGSGGTLPGICKIGPGDTPRCIYSTLRCIVVNSSGSRFNNVVAYGNGTAKWGESPTAGAWAGAGTDGGTNLVVLDMSAGVLPTFWQQQTQAAMAGLHMLATIMPVTGDTANVADRGATFAQRWADCPDCSVSQAWLTTLLSLPNGVGINGGGCNFVIAYDTTDHGALGHINENWHDLHNDDLDSKGTNVYEARWMCNWAFSQKDQTAFELP